MEDKNKFEKEKNGGYKIFNLIISRFFNLIVLVIVLLVFAVAFIYLINPKWQKILEEKEKVLTEKTAQKEKLQDIFNKIEKYKTDYENISSGDKAKINNIFLNGAKGKNYDQIELFSLFESLIGGQGFLLKSVEISGEDENQKDKPKKADDSNANLPAGVDKVVITLEVSGVDYKSFKNLLEKIENNLLIMDITELSFSPENNSANFKITTYKL